MTRSTALAFGLVLALGACAAPEAAPEPQSNNYLVATAVADDMRPEEDRARDSQRKPAEIVAFAGVREGDVVAELLPGGGYYTRILAKSVGPEGHVYAVVPPFFANRPGGLDGINALVAQYGNVSVVVTDMAELDLPQPVDLVWTTENYHDLHNGENPQVAAVNEAVFSALKPGGIYFVEDHAAKAGAGTAATSTVHRIDPQAAIDEVTAAGFTLEEQSDLLANPDDPKDVAVFDPAIRGNTERFALRFRKPG